MKQNPTIHRAKRYVFQIISLVYCIFLTNASIAIGSTNRSFDCENPPGPAIIHTTEGQHCEVYALELQAETNYVGTGLWSVISGPGIILDANAATTEIFELVEGEITIVRWTVSNEDCADVYDEISIIPGNSAPQITFNAPICEGQTLILQIAGGINFISYEWLDPQQNIVGTDPILEIPNVTQNMSGVYTLNLIDEFGCSIAAFQGVEIQGGDISDAGPDEIVCTENNYTLNGNQPQNGTGLWTIISGTGTFSDPTNPTTEITDFGIGENILIWTITSYFNCPTSSDTVIITRGNEAPQITSNAPICGGQILILQVTGGITFSSYEWLDPQQNIVGTDPVLEIPNVTQDMNGVYTLNLIDEFGCLITAYKGVEIQGGDIADAGPDEIICTENNYTLNGNQPQNGTGLWTLISGTGTITDPTNPTTEITDLGIGQNILVWTITSNFNCPTSSDTVVITRGNEAPQITSNAPICEGQTLILQVTSGITFTSYEWLDPQQNNVGTDPILEIPHVTQSMSGVYTLNLIDEFGCSITAYKGVEIQGGDIADAGPDEIICTENNYTLNGNQPQNGTGLWTIISGTGTFFDPTNPTTEVTDLGIGENILVWTITSNFDCPTSSDTVIITRGIEAPVITSNAPICEGQTLILQVSGGINFTSYEWLNPQQNIIGTDPILEIPNVTQNMTGVFTLNLIDEFGCAITAYKGVEIQGGDIADAGPDEIVCTENNYTLNGNQPQNGTGFWTIISGTGTFSDPTNPTTEITDLGIGENILVWTITSNFDCPTSSDTVIITRGNEAPQITSNAPICEGQTLILQVTGGINFTSYEWLNPQQNIIGTDPILEIPNVTQNMTGVYTLNLIDEFGCAIAAFQGVEIQGGDIADAGSDEIICTENNYILNGNQPQNGIGLWTIISGTGTFSDPTNPTTEITDLGIGQNILVWTITSYFNCPTSSDTVVITRGNEAPQITSNGPICEGQTLILQVTSGITFTSYEWLDPQQNIVGTDPILEIPNVSQDMTGVFTLNLIDEFGCSIAAFQGVEIQGGDIADAGPDETICTENNYTLNGNQPQNGTGLWTIISGTGTFSDPTNPTTEITDLGVGENILVWTITSYFNCPTSSDTVIITRGYEAPVIISNAPICEGQTLILQIEGGITFTSYEWMDPQQNIVGTDPILEIPNVTQNMTGVYTLNLIDEFGCLITAYKGVEIQGGDIADAGPDEIVCTENNYILNGNQPQNGTGFWTIISGTGTFSDPTNPTTEITDLGIGQNILVWTITSYFNCPTSSDTVVITRGNEAPQITSNGPICEGQTLILQVTSGITFTSYEWLDPQQNIVGTDPILEIPNVSQDMTGVFTLNLIDEFGCSIAAFQGVEIQGGDIADAGPDETICTENNYTLNGNQPQNGTGLWTIISGTGTFSDPTNPTTEITDFGIGENILIWTITSYFNCPTSSDTVIITRGYEAPVIISNAPICEGQTLILQIEGGITFTSYEWMDPQQNIVGTDPILEIPNVTQNMTGVYTLNLIDEFGCLITAYKGVEIQGGDIADAGPDEIVCTENNYTLNGNQPQNGTGLWTIISGTGTFSDPTNPTTEITDFGIGENILIWTITSYFNCPTSSDTVIITRGNEAPQITSNAPICGGQTLILQVTGGITFSSYEWLDPQQNIVGTDPVLEIPNVTQDMSGVYTLNLIDEFGCSITAYKGVEIQGGDIADAGPDEIVCTENNYILNGNQPQNGTGLWTLISGTGTFSDPTNPTTEITDLGVGENILVWTITSYFNCPTSSDTVIITRGYEAPVIISNAPICEGQTLILQIEGGITFTSYEWMDPQQNIVGTDPILEIPNVTQNMSGVYTLSTIDEFGCQKSDTIDILIDILTMADAGLDQLVCDKSFTQLSAVLPAFSYGTWTVVSGSGTFSNPNDPFSLVSGLSLGDNVFSWSVVPTNSCTQTSDQVVIKVGQPALLISTDAPKCSGEDIFLSGQGNNLVSYAWSGPEGFTSTESNIILPDFTTDHSGIYRLEVIDLVGCTAVETIYVEVFIVPTVSAGMDITACSGTNAVLNANLEIGQNGFWQIIDGSATIVDINDPKSLLINSLDDIVLLSWNVIDSHGCMNSDTVSVNYSTSTPAAFAGEDIRICASEPTLRLDALQPGSGSGAWQLVSGFADIDDINDANTLISNIQPDTSGRLVLTWTIDDPCHEGQPSAHDEVVITIDQVPGPATILTLDTILCQQNELILSADNNYTGTGIWTIVSGQATISDPLDQGTSVNGLNFNSTVILRWTVSNGICSSAYSELEITAVAAPDNAIAGDDLHLCNENSIFLSADAAINGVGGWRITEGSADILEPNNPTSELRNLLPGSLTSLVWEISVEGCTSTIDTLHILNDDLPSLATVGEDQQLCNEDQLIVIGNNPLLGSSSWNLLDGPGSLSSTQNSIDTLNIFTKDSLMRLVYIIENGICPVSTDTLNVISYQLPDVALAGSDILACKDLVTLNAQPVFSGTGVWGIVSGNGVLVDANSAATDIYNLDNNDSITLNWTVSNGTCPDNVDQIIISVAPSFLNADAGEDLDPCNSSGIILNAAPAPHSSIGTWNIIFGEGNISDRHNANATITELISGFQTILTWTLSDGICPDVVDTMTINNLDGADILTNFLINKSGCVGDSIVIIDISEIPVMNDPTFKWIVNGEFFSVDRDPIITFDEPGLNTIQLEMSVGDCVNYSPVKEINILSCLKEHKDSLTIDNLITAFPNPTNGNIVIEITQSHPQSTLIVYNTSGAVVMQENIDGNYIRKQLNLVNSGFYFVRIINPNFEKTIKVLKL